MEKSTSVFVATDSQTSLLNSTNTFHLRFISSVGADANNLSELDESIIGDFKIITDSIQSMLLGDMKCWGEKELLSHNDLTLLKDIICSKVKLEEKILFVSTGIALQDALIAQFIVNKKDK